MGMVLRQLKILRLWWDWHTVFHEDRLIINWDFRRPLHRLCHTFTLWHSGGHWLLPFTYLSWCELEIRAITLLLLILAGAGHDAFRSSFKPTGTARWHYICVWLLSVSFPSSLFSRGHCLSCSNLAPQSFYFRSLRLDLVLVFSVLGLNLLVFRSYLVF